MSNTTAKTNSIEIHGGKNQRIRSVSFSVGDSSEESDDESGDSIKANQVGFRDLGAHLAWQRPTNGLFHTFLKFMKGSIGMGILVMPDAVRNGGLIFGSFGIVMLGILSAYCCHLLLRAYRRISDKPMSYADVAEISFRRARHPYLQRLARPVRFFITTLFVLSRLGFLSVSIKFCGRLVKEITEDYLEAAPHGIVFYETFTTIFLIPYCFVKAFKTLAICSVIANALFMVCLIPVIKYVFWDLEPVNNLLWFPAGFETVPLCFGTAMFAFQSIMLVLPLENGMKDRAKFHDLFSLSMVMVVTLHAATGFYGYRAFGDWSEQTILSNLPRTYGFYSCLRWMFAVSIFISYNLQLQAPVQAIYALLQKMRYITANPRFSTLFTRNGECFVRLAIIIFTYICAFFVPCLELMISLCGALCASFLALIFPPIIELVSSLHEFPPVIKRLRTKELLKCGAISLFGLTGCFFGTFASLQAIFNHPEETDAI